MYITTIVSTKPVTGRDIAASILAFIEKHKIMIGKLIFLGGDATATNSGPLVSILSSVIKFIFWLHSSNIGLLNIPTSYASPQKYSIVTIFNCDYIPKILSWSCCI
jgi:sorbitol-specific phosphotransferase system component IIBC